MSIIQIEFFRFNTEFRHMLWNRHNKNQKPKIRGPDFRAIILGFYVNQ